MEYLLVNAKVIGRPKNELFDVLIHDLVVASIYPAGIDRSCPTQVDLQQGWIAPAFVDAHVHTTNTGVMIAGLDLSDCKSFDELRNRLQKLDNTDSIVLGHGWDDSQWSRKADSSVFSDSAPPIYISRIDAHSALVSKSLISKIPNIKNLDGFSETEPIKREAHGVVREFAYSQLSSVQRSKYQNIAIDAFLKNGICEVHEMAGPLISSFTDAKLFNENMLNRGLRSQLWWGELNGHENAIALSSQGCGGDLFIDGSFGSKTAFVKNEYLDGGRGFQYISQEQAVGHILRGYEYGLSTSFHVIGDAAIEVATHAFDKVKAEIGYDRYSSLNHRLEHVEHLSPQSITKLVDLNITFSMQPKFSSTWAGETGMYQDRIGEDWRKLNPFMPILKAGGRLMFGSDSPVTNLNPWETVSAAMKMHNSEFSITQKAAFRASTTNLGQVQVGDIANLAVWNVNDWAELKSEEAIHKWSTDSRSFPVDYPNPFSPPQCLMTIVSGKILYSELGNADD